MFKLESFNLNFDKRERHWIDFILFGRLYISLNRTRIGMISKYFHYYNHATGNKTIILFGRINLTLTKGASK